MEKYLSKFTNLSDYINFRNTDIPEINVSYVESLDRVIYYSGDKANKNFYFKVLNPENISQWDTDSNGREYININPLGERSMRVYYLTDGENRGTDDDDIVFKLYKDSDYTITILWQEAGGYPGVKGIGRDNSSNTFGLKYKVGGNINSWFRMSNEDLSSFVLPSDWQYTQYNELFKGNKYVLDFTDLYIPVCENYKYINMFSEFNIDSNDTLLMTDFYFNNFIQEHWSGQYAGMLRGMSVSNFGLYFSTDRIYNQQFNSIFENSTFTTVPKIVVDFNGGESNFMYWFNSCGNLTDIWLPNINKIYESIALNFDHMYNECISLTDLSSYSLDFTHTDNIQHSYNLSHMFAAESGNGSLTKAPKIKTNNWRGDLIQVDNIFKGQANLSEIYILGNDPGAYNSGIDPNYYVDTTNSLPASGTVYVTDTNVNINTLNERFGIPTTWTLAIYSE